MSGKGLGWKRACRGKARRRYCPLALEKRAGRKTKHKISLSFTSYKACVIMYRVLWFSLFETKQSIVINVVVPYYKMCNSKHCQ